jgi:drug/metabolite transporter (DMT)-like permease
MKKAFLQLHIAVFLAGFTGILGRLITLNEGMIVWYRLLFTAVTMWILFGAMKKLERIPLTDILKIGGVGFIAAMHWVTFYGSIKYSNVSVGLVCFSAIGFFTAVLEPIVLRLLPFYLQRFPVASFFPGKWDLIWLLVLSWFCSVMAFQFSSNALKKLSAFTVNLTYNLEPVYGILLAFIVYHENQLLSKYFYIGFAIIALALVVHIILVAREEQKKRKMNGVVGLS